MTKSLRGLSSRNFITTNIVEESFVGRETIAALRAATLSPTDASLGDSGSFSAEVIFLDDDSGSEVLVLECLDPKEMMIRFVERGGNASTFFAAPPTGGEIFDEGALGVAVGGSVSGVIDFGGDIDTISVYLIAGQTYLISMRGTGGTPLDDSYIEVYDPTAAFVTFDDDGGTSRNSLLTFTASTTGNYEIDAQAFGIGAADIGGYTVDVRVQGVDAIGFTNLTSVPLSLGTTFGFREFGTGNQSPIPGVLDGDTDRYSVTLEAGHFYTFEVAAGWDGGASGVNSMNTLIVLRNAAGSIQNSGTSQNDNIGSDLSSALGFTATVSGTYYLDVHARNGQTGGYVINFQDVDFSSLSPLDTINWFDADNIDTVDVAGVPTAYVYFGAAGDDFGEGLTTLGWNATEKSAVMTALLEFSKITGIQYLETGNIAEAEFRLNTINDAGAPFGAYFYPQDPGFGTAEGIGIFNKISGGWTIEPSPGVQPSLERGGYSFAVILHEFGHGHGLAHPHDNGGDSEIMPGMFAANGNGFFSVYNMAQGVYTVMTYNDAWRFHPDGNSPFTVAGIDNGWSASLSAFDIAVLQDRYGVHAHNAGNNVYTLTDVVDDAFYECIWDSGGTDGIAYAGTLSAIVDLTAATLDYSPTGGGVMSFLDAGPGAQLLRGGFTIANGVVIENASTGSGNDQLVGNSAANDLSGNGGADLFIGRAGDDAIHGGAGSDTAFYQGNRNDYTITAILTNGAITGFTVRDDNIAAPAEDNLPIVVANEGTDTLDGIETLSFADGSIAIVGNVLVYDGDGHLVSTHATIQGAIDAGTTLDGYTIFAGAGTYAEDVNVTKDLTIQGANLGVSGDDGARVAETSIRSLAISANGVTVDGVEVTGTVTYGSYLAGIYVSGDNFSLVNSVLDGPDTGPPFTSPVGILTEQVADLDVGDNLITGYSQGIYASGGATTGSVHDNVFQGDGSGSGSGTQNGVLSESTLMLIETNTFDGIDGGSFYALPQGPGDTLDLLDIFINNIISDSGAARPVQIYPSTLTPNVLGTDESEAFVGDWGGLGGVDLSFDGRGGADHIYGDSGNDTFTGGADNDLLIGGAGTDTAVFDDAVVSYIDTAIGWVVSSSDGNDFLQQMEIVEADGQRNLLVGGTGYGTLQAALTAAQTDDNVRLAAGNYNGTVNYSVDGLTVIAQPGAVQNLTYATASAFGITVQAANGADSLTGSANDDSLSGGGGADYLNGAAGADTMSGGTGNDVYFIENVGDQVIEAASEGFDSAHSSVSYQLTAGSEVEVLSTTNGGGNAAIALTGNEFGQTITGNAGNNFLNGGGGADTLDGGAGNDVIIVDGDDLVVEAIGGGNDLVAATTSYALNAGAEVETLSTINGGNNAAIALTGNEFGQLIIGNAGNNFLNGGGGADTLDGGAGNDVIIVDADDLVVEAIGGGNDLVAALTSYALNAGAEVETLSTTNGGNNAAINLTGNEFGQTIIGNAGANVLDGKGGNDTLVGGLGADTFAFTSALGAGNVDAISDMTAGTDKIALDDAVFTAIGGLGTLNANAFVIGSAAADADDRIIYNSATGQLFYDADGNGAGAAVQFASLSSGLALTASDFMVI